MKYACDLHIHTALSPCAEDEMTPNNIVNMAIIKGLDIISITDHNSAKNVRAAIECAKEKNIIILPGIEVNTREDIHVLCYFADVSILEEFDAWLYSKLINMPFDKTKFGNQLIMNEKDEVVSFEEKYLLQGADVSIDELMLKTDAMGGVAVPAHINRMENSLTYILGFIPPNPLITSVELSRFAPTPEFDISKYHILHSSDAHDLGSILEREFYIDLNERSSESLIVYLKQKIK